jgi:hypothetical protein
MAIQLLGSRVVLSSIELVVSLFVSLLMKFIDINQCCEAEQISSDPEYMTYVLAVVDMAVNLQIQAR